MTERTLDEQVDVPFKTFVMLQTIHFQQESVVEEGTPGQIIHLLGVLAKEMVKKPVVPSFLNAKLQMQSTVSFVSNATPIVKQLSL